MADDEMKFFDGTPVRKEVFEDYDPNAKPKEVIGKSDGPLGDSNEKMKREISKPSSESDVFNVGLPSTAMGETPPENVDADQEEWEQAKEKPDDRLHNLWRAYRYGTDHTEPGNKRVRGQIVGELDGMIYKAVHNVGGGAPMGELEREGRRQVLKAADQYDPTFGAKLSTYAHDKLFPNGSNVLTNKVRKYGDSVQLSEDRFSKVMEYKDFITDFKNKHGREPSNEEISDRLNISLDDVKKMRREAADEHDVTQLLDDDEAATGNSFQEKDAIKAVYYDSNPDEQRAMEYMFPDVLDGEEPPVDIDAGGMGWIGDQIGKSSSGMSKMKSRIESRIKELL